MHLKLYHDPSHGWLAVKRQTLIDLGIADKVSSHSYQRGDTVYLEEDCDASLFYKATKGQFSVESIYQERTPIRSYERYSPTFREE